MAVSQPVGRRNWGWLFVALWCGLIFLSSSISEITTLRTVFARDKLIHLAEYAVLGVLAAAALSELTSWRARVRAVAALGFCAVFAALDEIYQISVSGRATDFLDFASDCMGAALGQLVLLRGRFRGDRRSRGDRR